MGSLRTGGNARRWVSHPLVTVGLVVLFGTADTGWAQTSGRVIYMAAVEMKGGTQQEKEPYPEAPLPPGAGYEKTPPSRAGR